MEYLNKHPEIKVVFQPGTYQIKFGSTALADIYKHSELFFCNLEEAQIILKESMGDALLGADGKPTRDMRVAVLLMAFRRVATKSEGYPFAINKNIVKFPHSKACGSSPTNSDSRPQLTMRSQKRQPYACRLPCAML